MFETYKVKRKLKKLIIYNEKKIAYHEAGHLVFSYLIGISCKYIDTSCLSKIEKITQKGQKYLSLDFISKAKVDHNLPPDIDDVLKNLSDLKSLTLRTNKSEQKILSLIMQYLFVLLAGHKTLDFFIYKIIQKDLEILDKQYGQNITLKTLNEDKTRAKYILDTLTNDVVFKNKIIKQVYKTIEEYLIEDEIQNAIINIVKATRKSKKISNKQIEKIFTGIDFMKFI